MQLQLLVYCMWTNYNTCCRTQSFVILQDWKNNPFPVPTRPYFYESQVILLFVLLVTFHLRLKLGSWAQSLQTDHNVFLCLAMYLVRCVIHAHCFVSCNFCHPRAQMLRGTAGKTIFLQLVIAPTRVLPWGVGWAEIIRGTYIFVRIYDDHAMPRWHASQAHTWLKKIWLQILWPQMKRKEKKIIFVVL